MIVAPRLKKYKEHVNDHQLQILKTFEVHTAKKTIHNPLKELILNAFPQN